ncbi:hypothetical protein BDV33DRAFT_191867 [Aspergillus novoparasiticus]|uniref:Zn(2)-C6 fungal-type domain-containing protein n=1 Tax=Aspergillus novoparasiticus TaxID=986946 RepID=A0A5N6EPR3_9EURO|nr:hypothetical protein BDV33DRAFT_191867 [Aspergillus novoparasiticus]
MCAASIKISLMKAPLPQPQLPMSNITTEPAKSCRQNKELACEECRSCKLKCDMSQPQCSTCRNLGVPCITNTARRPRGPRKSHVNVLRSRIGGSYLCESCLSISANLIMRSTASLERYRRESSASIRQILEAEQAVKVDPNEIEKVSVVHSQGSPDDVFLDTQSIGLPKWPSVIPSLKLDSECANPTKQYTQISVVCMSDRRQHKPNGTGLPGNNTAVPTISSSRSVVTPRAGRSNELTRGHRDDLFFDRAYPFAPIIHQQRYYARATHESDTREPFTSLQYAMRTLAASMGTQFQGVLPLLYTHTYCLLDVWEQNTPNEALPIDVVQARLLLGWISAGRCFHLVHLVKLDRIDNPNSWQTSSLSWVEIKERGRTFWTAYALDRYANLINGLPLTLNDQMAKTAFRHQQAVTTEYLAPAMAKRGDQQLSPYANRLSQCNVERILNPISQECIARHRALDTILSHEVQTTLSSVAAGLGPCDPTVFFTDMLAQTTVLVLFTALNSVPEAADMLQDLYGSYETKASMAMKKVLGQAQKLSRIGSFKARLVPQGHSIISDKRIRSIHSHRSRCSLVPSFRAHARGSTISLRRSSRPFLPP